MGIQQVESRTSVPEPRKIRLGVRKEGTAFPKNVEYFVLKDAPEVEAVYGKDPKELDIIFLSDDLDESIPTWLKWWSGGVKGKDGNVIGGKLVCKGNGPGADGKPGIAEWWAKREPGQPVPTRECLGDKCPDWNDTKGNRQCKPSMQVFFLLPLVTLHDFYEIDTTSWKTIHSFHDRLRYIKQVNNGKVKLLPFKIVREEEPTEYTDPRTGERKKGTQWVMKLKSNEEFMVKHADRVKEIVAKTSLLEKSLTLPTPQQAALMPMEDNFPVLDAEASSGERVLTAQDLLLDADINQAFSDLEAVTQKKFEEKARLISIRKLENKPNVKEAVISSIQDVIRKELAKNSSAGSVAQGAQGQPPIEIDADGII
jgi:hypothetical protein